MIVALVLMAALIAVALGGAIVGYNRLQSSREATREAWAQVDVQLTRRHHTVDDLVTVVQAAAAHERATLDRVIEARNRVHSQPAGPDTTLAGVEAELETSTRGLVAIAERYPDLAANERFSQLAQQLIMIEDDLASSRRYFNGRVRIYNTLIETVPTAFLAGPLGFDAATYFQADQDEREAPRAD